MSPDFRSLPLGFPEFWRIQLPQNPSRRCHSGLSSFDRYGPAAKTAGYTLSPLSWLRTLKSADGSSAIFIVRELQATIGLAAFTTGSRSTNVVKRNLEATPNASYTHLSFTSDSQTPSH